MKKEDAQTCYEVNPKPEALERRARLMDATKPRVTAAKLNAEYALPASSLSHLS